MFIQSIINKLIRNDKERQSDKWYKEQKEKSMLEIRKISEDIIEHIKKNKEENTYQFVYPKSRFLNIIGITGEDINRLIINSIYSKLDIVVTLEVYEEPRNMTQNLIIRRVWGEVNERYIYRTTTNRK